MLKFVGRSTFKILQWIGIAGMLLVLVGLVFRVLPVAGQDSCIDHGGGWDSERSCCVTMAQDIHAKQCAYSEAFFHCLDVTGRYDAFDAATASCKQLTQ